MVPHVIPQLITRKQYHMVHMTCTMTKLWNPTTQLTPLNNYPSNCVITSSYRTIGMCEHMLPTESGHIPADKIFMG
jgi:hypothetical protein